MIISDISRNNKNPEGVFQMPKNTLHPIYLAVACLLASAPSAPIAHLASFLENKAAIARWADPFLDFLRFGKNFRSLGRRNLISCRRNIYLGHGNPVTHSHIGILKTCFIVVIKKP
jgi:hypothetical protein